MARTIAALRHAGRVIGYTYTTAKGGDVVSFGKALESGGIHEYGKATVTRARAALHAIHEAELPRFDVNFGGGKAL
jgi:hypothetical protein